MKKLKIKNRQGLKISVVIDEPKNPQGLVFVMHGLGGFMKQPHIQTFAKAFKESGFTTLLWDATNSIGESDGKMEDATLTNYYQDLEDVIKWAQSQSFYIEPFILCGHSLGGISSILYAEKFPQKVKALVPISTVVSGKLSVSTEDPKRLKEWEKMGYKIDISQSKPGMEKKLKWSHIKDRLKYDVLPAINKITMPVLLIVGDKDYVTPVKHQQILYKALKTANKQLQIIKDAPHTFIKPQHLAQIKQIISNWIEKVMQF